MRLINYDTDNLVSSHRGNLPILITAGHGGEQQPRGVPARDKDNHPEECVTRSGINGFNANTDLRTRVITFRLVREIEKLTNLTPYVVIADFRRRYIDANRNSRLSVMDDDDDDDREVNCAYQDIDARAFYDFYHQTIANFREEILEENNRKGFLFDIHGTGGVSPSADIYIGTRSGRSLPTWFPPEALFMREGLIGILESIDGILDVVPRVPYSYRVNPTRVGQREAQNGGFTIENYFGNEMACIQIELNRVMRDSRGRRLALYGDLALAIVKSVNQFINI